MDVAIGNLKLVHLDIKLLILMHQSFYGALKPEVFHLSHQVQLRKIIPRRIMLETCICWIKFEDFKQVFYLVEDLDLAGKYPGHGKILVQFDIHIQGDAIKQTFSNLVILQSTVYGRYQLVWTFGEDRLKGIGRRRRYKVPSLVISRS